MKTVRFSSRNLNSRRDRRFQNGFVSQPRKALAQPRLLLAGMGVVLGALVWGGIAQERATLKSLVEARRNAPRTKAAAATANGIGKKPVTLSNLGALVENYGAIRERQARLQSYKSGGRGASRFRLTENDLTPNSFSSETDAILSPDGSRIAFVSDGIDADGNKKLDSVRPTTPPAGFGNRHIWVMNRDGSNQKQVTGLATATDGSNRRSQERPSWSPDGNELVFVDSAGTTNPQLATIEPFTANSVPVTITFFPANRNALIQDPAWGGSGVIAFSTNWDDRVGQKKSLPSFDIFTIPPTGDVQSLRKITATAKDSGGNVAPGTGRGDEADDVGAAWSVVNPSILLFASNRTQTLDAENNPVSERVLPAIQRRIWVTNTTNFKRFQLTDPGLRVDGAGNRLYTNAEATKIADVNADSIDVSEDRPTASVRAGAPSPYTSGFKERFAYQSNARIDTSDKANDGAQDYNIWSMELDTTGSFLQQATAPPSLPAPALTVGSFGRGTGTTAIQGSAQEYGSSTGNYIRTDSFPTAINARVEGLAYVPDQSGDSFPDLVVINRAANTLDLFNGASGTYIKKLVTSDATGVPQPAAVLFQADLSTGANYLLVASGYNGDKKIHRFDLETGAPNPSAGVGSVFSGPETPALTGGLSGFEGMCFGPQGASDPYIYVTSFSTGTDKATGVGRVLRYDAQTGDFNRYFVDDDPATLADETGGLKGAVGLAFGPDIDGNGARDLFVSSSVTDDVKVYQGPGGTTGGGIANPGAPIILRTAGGVSLGNNNFVNDDGGTTLTRLNGPEVLLWADTNRDGEPEDLFVGSYGQTDDTNEDHVNRYRYDGSGTPIRATVNPGVDSTGALRPGAIFIQDARLKGPTGLAFNPTDPRSLQIYNPDLGESPPVPREGVEYEILDPEGTPLSVPILSQLESNEISSPASIVGANGKLIYTGAQQDKSVDKFPSYSLSPGAAQEAVTIAFSSKRLSAARPGSAVVNPSGSNGNAGTFDIWTTTSQDFTPPSVVPQSSGNLQYPVVAPGPQSPFAEGRPRTAETGLLARDKVVVAVVLRDLESGVATGGPSDTSAVKVSVKDAAQPQFPGYNGLDSADNSGNLEDYILDKKVDAGFGNVYIAPELPPAFAQNQDGATLQDIPMGVYDDGPPRMAGGVQVGHERQADAVAGDGVFYCEATIDTPNNESDFYLDISAYDKAGNGLNYDHLWGFSTKLFVKGVDSSGLSNDLFVSDYTVGQTFPHILSGGTFFLGTDPTDSDPTDDTKDYPGYIYPAYTDGVQRFTYMTPCESYWLSNPGSDLDDPTVGFSRSAIKSPLSRTGGDTPDVDVWRVLCRGPVPSNILSIYLPTQEPQFDPEDFTNGVPAGDVEKNRTIAVSRSGVIWASPYTGDVFAGPGTLADAQTQNRLTTYLSKGGRLWISGRDVVFSLANASTGQASTFLTDELRAQYKAETNDKFLPKGARNYADNAGARLELAINREINEPDYADASHNNQRYNRIDTFTSLPVTDPAKQSVTVAYTSGSSGATVGHEVIQDRSNGLQSRLVLFGFGFEGVNNYYTPTAPTIRSVRFNLAQDILYSFKTGSLSGEVRNKDTNQLIPNFYVKVTGGGVAHLARTDDQGKYSLNGLLLPGRGAFAYTAQPAVDALGNPLNPGYAVGNPGDTVTNGVSGITPIPGFNLRVTPFPPGEITAQVKRMDGSPVANLPVLVKSVGNLPTDRFPLGGRFAQIVTTNAVGLFSVSNVPSGSDIKYQVIFNPNAGNEASPSNTTATGDLPAGSSLDYGPGKTLQPNTLFGRLAVPEVDYSKSPPEAADQLVVIPSGGTYFLDDVENDTQAKDGAPAEVSAQGLVPFTITRGFTVSGTVKINTIPTSGVTVDLFLRGASQTNPPEKTATTDSAGKYEFSEVEAGDYTIVVTRGTTTNAPGRDVSVAGGQANVFNFNLTEPQITGQVLLNGSGPAAVGATVELLRADGTSFSPVRTATAGADGKYGIGGVVSGRTYQVRASKSGDVSVARTVVVTQSVQPAPNLNLLLQTVTGSVRLSSAGNPPAAGASVELRRNGAVVQSVTANSNGVYSFTDVLNGDYGVRATRNNSTGQVSVSVPRNGLTVSAPTITLQAASNQPGTSFSATDRTFAISVPFQDTNAPRTNNRADLNTRTNVGAYSALASAFSRPPIKGNGEFNYVLQRYNPESRQLESYNVSSNPFSIRRGEGYLLKVIASSDPTRPNGTDIKVAPVADNAAYLPLQGAITTFTFVLRRNPSISSDPTNGTNLIGFPFDPSKVSQVNWLNAEVFNPLTNETLTVPKAAAEGWITEKLTTLDPVTGSSIQVTQMFPYGAYYVKTTINGLEVKVKAP